MRAPYYEDLTTALYLGDCRKVMAEMPENSVDSIVTDPPYGLEFMGKEWDRLGDVKRANRGTQVTWKTNAPAFDLGVESARRMQEWHYSWAVEALRVLKPGGHALVFGGCYDAETEVLTERGWIPFPGVSDSDVFASLNPDSHLVEWLPPKEIVRQPHTGPMLHFKTNRVDLLVTPNHKMFVAALNQPLAKYRFERADSVSRAVRVTKTSMGRADTIDADFALPAGESRTGHGHCCFVPKKCIPLEAWLPFFGLWIAEGSASRVLAQRGYGYNVAIAHFDTNNLTEIERLLAPYFKVHVYPEAGKLRINNQQLYEYLHQFGYAHQKWLPDWLKHLSPKHLRLFLDWYARGDGDAEGRLYTSSARLRDDIQEIAMYAGWAVDWSVDAEHECFIGKRRIVQRHTAYVLRLLKSQVRPQMYDKRRRNPRVSLVPAEEWAGRTVYCVELPRNHTLYVRRNGKAVWCGNTRTHHRLMCALEDAGFEARDTLMWVYGSGFPKGGRVNRSPMFCQCAEIGRSGESINHEQERVFRTDMVGRPNDDGPPHEDAHRSRSRPLDSRADYPSGSDSSDVPSQKGAKGVQASFQQPERALGRTHSGEPVGAQENESLHSPFAAQYSAPRASMDSVPRSSCAENDQPEHKLGSRTPSDISESVDRNSDSSSNPSYLHYAPGFPCCQICGKPNVDGWDLALKPAYEPIVLCRKPLSEPTVAQNVLKWGVGGIWVDGSRTPLSTTDRLRACVRGIRAHVGNANGDSTEGRDRGHNESLFVRSLRNKPSSWVGVSLSPSSNGTASVPHSPSLLDSLVGCPACLRLGDALAHLVQGASQARFPSRQYAHKHTRLATHEGGLACEEVRSHLSGIGPLSISDSSHPDVSLYDLLRVSEPGLQAAARYLEWSLGHSHTCAPVGLSFVRPDRQTLSGIQLLRQTYVEIGSLDEDSASRSPLMYVFAVPLIVTNVWHYVEEALQRSGRWPANLLHDGSDEVLALFPNSKGLSEGDGSAARFFYDTGRGERDLLLGCAKTIMESWNVELANTADDNSSLPSEYAASALSRAVTGASHGDHQLSGLAGLSTSVTPRLLRHLCESVIIATLCIENESLPVSFHLGTVRLSGNLAKFAGTQGRIGTTMITASPTSFAGCAVIATLSCTRHSTVRGEVDYPSRLFYAAKASRSERDYGLENMPNHTPGEVTGGRQEGSAGLDSPRAGAGRTSGGHNPHPTVKPLSLMRWLCRLVTPPGGVVLDPFIGSGTTRLACIVEGFECIGIDQEQHYLDIAANRMVKPEDSV